MSDSDITPVDCQDFSQPSSALSNSGFQNFIDALDADRRLTRAEVAIATKLVNVARGTGYADMSITEMAEIGRVAMRSAAIIKKRLIDRGYFTIEKNGTERRDRFVPVLKIPIVVRRRARL